MTSRDAIREFNIRVRTIMGLLSYLNCNIKYKILFVLCGIWHVSGNIKNAWPEKPLTMNRKGIRRTMFADELFVQKSKNTQQ